MDPSDATQEKKIFVDEDWKAKVEAEREALKRGQTPEQPQGSPPRAPLPPPSLDFLVTTIAMQAMAGLGMTVDPATGKTELQLDQAKHFIDTLAMLQEKTQGNRTLDETATLERLLHELRMGYVMVQGRAATDPGLG